MSCTSEFYLLFCTRHAQIRREHHNASESLRDMIFIYIYRDVYIYMWFYIYIHIKTFLYMTSCLQGFRVLLEQLKVWPSGPILGLGAKWLPPNCREARMSSGACCAAVRCRSSTAMSRGRIFFEEFPDFQEVSGPSRGRGVGLQERVLKRAVVQLEAILCDPE